MGHRSVLGPADVTDAQLADIVARWSGQCPEDVVLTDSSASVVPYDLDAITTAGRYWVSGTVTSSRGLLPFRFFVKHIQSWSRSPLFAQVPETHRATALGMVPWRTEALIYRSDLPSRLPEGLAMPRAVAVHDLDDLSSAVWLEAVEVDDRAWSTADLARAAYLLGRLAGSPRVRPLAAIGEADTRRSVREYTQGRLAVQIVPLLLDDAFWQQPLLAATFSPGLRARLLAQLGRLEPSVREIEAMQLGTAHGDACTNNLLRTAGSSDLVLIDYGFWSTQPLGFDLGQLLLGDVQLGRRPAASLPELEAACLPAYVRGLQDEGVAVDEVTVRRGHALHMLVYNAFSAMPLELLGAAPDPRAHVVARERAAMAEFILDLVDDTGP